MVVHIPRHDGAFSQGFTAITAADEPVDDTGIAFGIFRAGRGLERSVRVERETAFILMSGILRMDVNGEEARLERASLFDDLPSAVHMPAGASLRFACDGEVELAWLETPNLGTFPPRVCRPEFVRTELRGAGILEDTSRRTVRTIFDVENTDPAATLVVGEVVNLQGRWSSYPPHHHAQPEIYHYRFTDPRGYGHAELGDQVVKVRHGDTVKILGGVDHPQCAAPGYGMYYLWVIRHLAGERYREPELASEHRWLAEKEVAR